MPTVTGHRLGAGSYLPPRCCEDRPGNKGIKHVWLALNKSFVFALLYEDAEEHVIPRLDEEQKNAAKFSKWFQERLRSAAPLMLCHEYKTPQFPVQSSFC